MPVTRQGENNAMTLESIQAMIDRAIQRNSTHTQDDASNSGGGPRRPVQLARVCSYTDFMKFQPLNFKGTKGVVGLSQWIEKIESVFHITSVPLIIKGNDVAAYTQRFQKLALMCTKFLADETEKIFFWVKGTTTPKYGFESCDPLETPMVEKSKLDEDKEGKVVDPSHYRGMIGSLLYLTASRPNRREGKDILLVQIFIDDIIFSSTNPDLCEKNLKVMCSKFKMLIMGKMLFFLRLQISQSPRGSFLNQSKYALKIIKKYGMETIDPMGTPMVEKSKLDANLQGKKVDPTRYRGMIGSPMI
nr:uncharacterized mitochondrial protein AtMg00810-like [Tanacetum cinerariifolium]